MCWSGRDQDAEMTKAQTAKLTLLSKRSGRDLEDLIERWNERAAIREYDGGMSRRDAEAYAMDDVTREAMASAR